MRKRIAAGTVALGLTAAAAFGAAQALAEGAGVTVTDAAGTAYTGDVAAGEKIFKQCAQCHSLKEGENRIGPTLYGIVGRTAGTIEGYSYSKANRESGKVWSEQVMFDYLENPRASIPGTKMAFVGLRKPQDRADVIAYIKANGPAPAAETPATETPAPETPAAPETPPAPETPAPAGTPTTP